MTTHIIPKAEFPAYREHKLQLVTQLQLHVALSTVLIALGLMFVAMRLFVRKHVLKKTYIDDWFVGFGMAIGVIAYGASTYLDVLKYKIFLHQISVRSDYIFMEVQYILLQLAYSMTFRTATVGYTLQALFGRLAILYTFNRLSASRTRNSRILRISLHVLGILMFLSAFPISWALSVTCTGLNQPESCKHRVRVSQMFLLLSVFNAVADAFIFVLPFVILRWAKLSRSERKGLYIMFGFGFVVFLISIARAIQSHIFVNLSKESKVSDTMQYTVPIGLAAAEGNGVMIAAALPVLRPLWRLIQEKWIRFRSGQSRALDIVEMNTAQLTDTSSAKENDNTADRDIEVKGNTVLLR